MNEAFITTASVMKDVELYSKDSLDFFVGKST